MSVEKTNQRIAKKGKSKMNKLERINKHTVMAQLRKGKSWSGYLVGDNTNSYHIVGGWCLGYEITIDTVNELNASIAAYEMYLDRELGKRAVLWQLVK